MENPLVSVILPTFNRSKIVEKSVRSILTQNYQNLELLVVNDASSDNTAQVLKHLSDQDERVRIVQNYARLGLPASRNRGISLSKGLLIFFSEDDLVINEDCISTLVNSFIELNKANQIVGAVGPRLINVPNRPNSLKYVVAINPFTKDIECNFALKTLNTVEVDLLHSCSIFSRKTLQSIGGYECTLYKGSYSKKKRICIFAFEIGIIICFLNHMP